MAYEDLVNEVSGLVQQGPPEALQRLSHRRADNYGSGMSAVRNKPPGTLVPNLNADPRGVYGGFARWHKAFGNAVNAAAGPAAMAAVGFPASGLLGTGQPPPETTFGDVNLQMDDNESLAAPSDTFGMMSGTERLLKIDYSHDITGPRGYLDLAEKLGGNRKASGFLQVMGQHLTQALPSVRMYATKTQDPAAALKAVAMLAAQVEFADEWSTFTFEGRTAPIVLREWHRLVTTGEGNDSVAVDGVMKFARALEWVQHPELLISPTVALSYMNLDDSEATVGLKVAQWPQRKMSELTEQQITNRMTAVSDMHPSGLIEPLVDNVRELMTRAMGNSREDVGYWIRKWRERSSGLPVKDSSHVSGIRGVSTVIPQMVKALEAVARETGQVDDVVVTAEEVNAITKEALDDLGGDLPGEFYDIITGASVPNLETLARIDQGTDFRRYRAKRRNIRMETNPDPATESLGVIVEAATDGTYKVLSEDGAQAFRNRAVGFISHNGRQATVPVSPHMEVDVETAFDAGVAEGARGAFFALDVTEDHPAFGEGPQVMVSVPAESADIALHQITSRMRAFGMRGEGREMTTHRRTVEQDGKVEAIAHRAMVFDLNQAADLSRLVQDLEANPLGESALVQLYANTDMDQPPGTVKQWETFATDDRGRMSVVDSSEGFASRTDQVPHYRLKSQAIKGESRSGLPVRSLDGVAPWDDGDVVHMHVPAYGSGGIPVASHNPDDLQGFDQSLVVTATRKPNGNIVIGAPTEDGRVETMLVKLAHEVVRNLGRKSITIGGKDVDS